nr:hypothetical protein [uncultured Roseovarius sp.]
MAEDANPTQFDALLLLIGKLNYSWTNTESLLIHLIAGLSRTDKETAVIIFLTLNTMRARVDLVERLAKMERVSEGERDCILKLTQDILKLSRLRNHYNHSIYAFDPQSGMARTILMRIADRKQEIKMGQATAIDAGALAELETAITDLGRLNHRFWDAIREYGYPT